MSPVNWPVAIKPLLKKYGGLPHPLEFKNNYQLLVAVILSSRDTDKHINELSPAFFKDYPNFKSLANTPPDELAEGHLKSVRSSRIKSRWLVAIASELQLRKDIPLQIDELVALPGIGRKTANVILRGAGAEPQGIIVDIHVLRVAPRLGITHQIEADKIEEELMQVLPKKQWEAGMAMSFLGRDTCRPKPLCEACIMKKVCEYYHTVFLVEKAG